MGFTSTDVDTLGQRPGGSANAQRVRNCPGVDAHARAGSTGAAGNLGNVIGLGNLLRSEEGVAQVDIDGAVRLVPHCHPQPVVNQ